MARKKQEKPDREGQIAVRVPAYLVHWLRQASVERKLRGEPPMMQNEIVREALEEWLRNHGHKKPKVPSKPRRGAER